MRAEEIRHLIVVDAERLPPPLWTLLADLASDLRPSPWRLWAELRWTALATPRGCGQSLVNARSAAIAPRSCEGQTYRWWLSGSIAGRSV
jgi:hypothetical protein